MTKKFVKKVIAITSVTSMLCAYGISASAATYTSSTTYFNSADTIQVSTTVSGLTAGDEVTYLAFDGATFNPSSSTIVYVNQYTTASNETTAKTFSYTTDTANVGSTIKMAKADSTFANAEAINPASSDTDTIDNPAVAFNIAIDGAPAVTYNVECTPDAENLQTITLPVVLGPGKEIKSMTIDGVSYGPEDVIVKPAEITIQECKVSDITVEGTITTGNIEGYEAAAPVAIGGFKDPTFRVTVGTVGREEEITGYAYAILADASNTPIDYEYGVAFASTSFESETPADVAYLQSTGRGTDNKFAIVYVDDADATGTVYYATYMRESDKAPVTFGTKGSIELTTTVQE